MTYKLSLLLDSVLTRIDNMDRVSWWYVFAACVVVGVFCMRGHTAKM